MHKRVIQESEERFVEIDLDKVEAVIFEKGEDRIDIFVVLSGVKYMVDPQFHRRIVGDLDLIQKGVSLTRQYVSVS